MAAAHNATSNGVNGHAATGLPNHFQRFSDIPDTVFVTVPEADGNIDVEVSLGEDIQDDPTELCTLLENEATAKSVWMTVALGYAKQRKTDVAIEVLSRSLAALHRGRPEDRLSLLNAMCWMYLLKCREAPRVKPDGQLSSEIKTKDHYIQQATGVLNEASRISPSYPPLFLARGVLLLLRASMQAPPKSATGAQVGSEKIETLKQAGKCFDDAIRSSVERNLMAHLGKARVSFSLAKYPEALQSYQFVLERAPDLIDPDPRIGIGCCLWQLDHKEDAKAAWMRALELNPDSKIANILMGLFYLQLSTQYNPSDPDFATTYKRAMTQYVQKAFKLDDKLPLACSTFGGYFLMKKAGDQAERLARRAIDLTDVHAIASDGWYLLARKEHYANDLAKANEYYTRSDQARGGDEKGYLPAKFGVAQIKVLMGDFDDAKYRLEKILQQSRSIEALTLLGTIYAEEVFAAQSTNSKEDKSQELKKAISYLDSVRIAWKDSKKKGVPTDSAVLLNLARLYEIDGYDDKALQCLLEVEKMEIDEIPEEDRPEDVADENELRDRLREFLPPQLLNNMGCFYHKIEKFDQARLLFQTALNACMKVDDKDGSLDKHALVTTIGFNLARTYESEGLLDDAKKVYEGTLQHYPDYTDAISRQAYIAILEDPKGEGWKSLQKLSQSEPSNLEVRALYGWFLQRSKKRTLNLADDYEFRHYKHTLQHFDKHDRYSLVGMGNIHLTIAREMPRDTEQAKDRRRKMYEKAVEFFDKALQLDSQNAYAAQGIAIALVEDKKDLTTSVQIFSKVKETMKDPSVYMNLGHLYTELKQYGRAIENYEAALSKDRTREGNARDRSRDSMTLSCLGRVWLMKGRHDKNLKAMKTALDYAKRALEITPEHPVSKFNVAFVQIQIAQLVHTLPETQRTLEEVETAAADLDEAIESFIAIANAPDPPYPKNDIEQRANMGKNTMRRQLERALQSQREYEEKHAAKLQKAREAREAEIKKREQEKRKVEEEAAEKQRKIAEERQKMREQDLEYLQKRQEEEQKRKELMEEEEIRKAERSANRGGKSRNKRKKKGDGSDSEEEGVSTDDDRAGHNDASASPATSGDERPPQKKKRKLERKSKASSKYKSQEIIVDSDSDADAGPASSDREKGADGVGSGSGDNSEVVTRPRTKATRVIDDDDEEDGENDTSMPDISAGNRVNESDSDE